MSIASEFLCRAADIRRTGSASLDIAYVACGRTDVFFELILKPWDYAAGALLLQEAGGILNMPGRQTIDYDQSTEILASNSLCFREAKKNY